ncbi:MAG: GNAT family N-acetyltransferase [Anaerolineales bacterium]
MKLERIYNREQLAAYFRKDLALHAYSLGDLDEPYWSRTSYYGIRDTEGLTDVFLIYKGYGLPVLLAMGPEGYLKGDSLRQLEKLLPDEFYAHLSPGLEDSLGEKFCLQTHGLHYKMALSEPSMVKDIPAENTVHLEPEDLPELEELYQESYPDNAFDPRLLSGGKFIGYRISGRLVSAAGVHVYSARYRVAALGNITTHPDFRNMGFARVVTARLCRELTKEVDFIGLNVKSENQPAVHLYQSLGFKIAEKYGEFSLKRRI